MDPVELIARREQLGLSQSALADALDVKQASISHYETGKREIPEWMGHELTHLELLQEQLIEICFDTVSMSDSKRVALLVLPERDLLEKWNHDRPLPESFVRVAVAQARLSLVEDGKDVRIATGE